MTWLKKKLLTTFPALKCLRDQKKHKQRSHFLVV